MIFIGVGKLSEIESCSTKSAIYESPAAATVGAAIAASWTCLACLYVFVGGVNPRQPMILICCDVGWRRTSEKKSLIFVLPLIMIFLVEL